MNSLRIILLVCALFSKAEAVDFGTPSVAPDVLSLAFEVNESQGSHKIFCSALLVHPKVLLSAAHCFQDGNIRQSHREQRQRAQKIKVFLGHTSDEGFVSENLVDIERFHIHPRYLRDIRGQADIAVVVLKTPLTNQKIRPMALDFDVLNRFVKKGAGVQISGFGFSEQMQGRFGQTTESFGQKHEGTLKIEGRTSSEILVVAGSAVDRFGLYRPAPREGDSGGPIFLDVHGVSYSLGLVSRATRFNHGPHGSAFSLIRHWICWIESVAKQRLRPEGGADYCSSQSSSAQENFQSMCERGSDSQRYTIEVLHKKLKTQSCHQLEEKLNRSTNLSLEASYIKNIDVLKFFPHLERLILRDNAIEDIQVFQSFYKLRTLDISYNNIRRFKPLQELKDLWLIGERRQYNNIGRTEFIRQCQDSKIQGEARKTIKSILQILGFNSGDCVDGNYELIRRRDLSFEQVTELQDFSMLKNIHTLENLSFKGQMIEDFSFLSSLSELKSLKLDSIRSPLTVEWIKLKNLESLSLQHSGISDLSFLESLPRLRHLNIEGHRVRDLTPLFARMRKGTLFVTGLDTQDKE